MNLRLQLGIPTWRFSMPDWTLSLRHTLAIRADRPGEEPDVERIAQRATRNRRVDGLRIDAERHWAGLERR